jgi:hypothetical protein
MYQERDRLRLLVQFRKACIDRLPAEARKPPERQPESTSASRREGPLR